MLKESGADWTSDFSGLGGAMKMDALKTLLNRGIQQNERDFRVGYDGILLMGQLEKNIKMRAGSLSGNERRRYHIHEAALQGSLRATVKKAKIPKQVTFREVDGVLGIAFTIPILHLLCVGFLCKHLAEHLMQDAAMTIIFHFHGVIEAY